MLLQGQVPLCKQQSRKSPRKQKQLCLAEVIHLLAFHCLSTENV